MYDKVIMKKCQTCGKEFQSDVIFVRGKLCCYVDCPACKKSKKRYLGSVDIYADLYDKNSEG